MLDELLEYKQYTYLFDQPEQERPIRLKQDTLINGKGSGLNRALTTIARYYLFHVCDYGSVNPEEKARYIDKTKDVLRGWMGFPFSGEPDSYALGLRNWLPDYILNVLFEEKSKGLMNDKAISSDDRLKDVIRKLLDEFSDPNERRRNAVARKIIDKCEGVLPKNKRFDKTILNIAGFLERIPDMKRTMEGQWYEVSEENDINEITFDKILANAIREGQLKEYYLSCQAKAYKNALGGLKTEGGPTKPNMDVVLKLTASYLLNCKKRGIENNSSLATHICKADVTNWLVNEKCETDHMVCYLYKNEPLFERTNLAGFEFKNKKSSNSFMLRLSKRWVEECGWGLIEADTDPERQNVCSAPKEADCLIFTDQGAGVKLKSENSI